MFGNLGTILKVLTQTRVVEVVGAAGIAMVSAMSFVGLCDQVIAIWKKKTADYLSLAMFAAFFMSVMTGYLYACQKELVLMQWCNLLRLPLLFAVVVGITRFGSLSPFDIGTVSALGVIAFGVCLQPCAAEPYMVLCGAIATLLLIHQIAIVCVNRSVGSLRISVASAQFLSAFFWWVYFVSTRCSTSVFVLSLLNTVLSAILLGVTFLYGAPRKRSMFRLRPIIEVVNKSVP